MMDWRDGPTLLRKIVGVKRCLTHSLVEWSQSEGSFCLSHSTDFGLERDRSLSTSTDLKSYNLRSSNICQIHNFGIHRASLQTEIMVDHWIKHASINGASSSSNSLGQRICWPPNGKFVSTVGIVGSTWAWGSRPKNTLVQFGYIWSPEVLLNGA